jgi:hypothetical protein
MNIFTTPMEEILVRVLMGCGSADLTRDFIFESVQSGEISKEITNQSAQDRNKDVAVELLIYLR